MIPFLIFSIFVCAMNIVSRFKINHTGDLNLSLYRKDDYEYIKRRSQAAFYEGLFVGTLLTSVFIHFGR